MDWACQASRTHGDRRSRAWHVWARGLQARMLRGCGCCWRMVPALAQCAHGLLAGPAQHHRAMTQEGRHIQLPRNTVGDPEDSRFPGLLKTDTKGSMQVIFPVFQKVPSNPSTQVAGRCGGHMGYSQIFGDPQFLVTFISSVFFGVRISCSIVAESIHRFCARCMPRLHLNRSMSDSYLSTTVNASRNKNCTCNLPHSTRLRI